MSSVAVIGSQWGDEGKGKVVDYLAKDADIVVRFNGGNNAGHSVQIDGDRFKVHMLPAGVFRGLECVIGNGCVIDPLVLAQEIKDFTQRTGQMPWLKISDRAHLILSTHILRDAEQEQGRNLGTTKRGNGPAYSDKAARTGIRLADVDWSNVDAIEDSITPHILRGMKLINHMYLMLGDQRRDYCMAVASLGRYVCDTTDLLSRRIQQGKRLLFEGAHGTMLDIDHGSYPFVSSSNCTIGGVCSGSGVVPRDLQVVGVVKAYSTRIGAGPFVTEIHDPHLTEHIRETGREYGTTTGRPRRIGWLDLNVIRRACQINGFDYLALTLLDVLSGLDEIKVCIYYRNHILGVSLPVGCIPANADQYSEVIPVYRAIPGWKEDISECQSLQDLPWSAKALIGLIESCVGVPVGLISLSPERDQMIDLRI